eukprot:TRINITY_DN32916_c0_g1_i1.p1 TRINITY_DN32916_c0_g1~~TRINITY_DN32916_c0_g1_i1.p1  ORF type:complete len:345 (+),score=33.48 TRINITY_DN32916_c0_g1_i1:73-1107(+)
MAGKGSSGLALSSKLLILTLVFVVVCNILLLWRRPPILESHGVIGGEDSLDVDQSHRNLEEMVLADIDSRERQAQTVQLTTKTSRPPGYGCEWSASKAGFIPGCCQDCKRFPSLHVAQDACLEDFSCGGVTFVGTEFELRGNRQVEPSPNGEVSYVKTCLPVTPVPSAFGLRHISCDTTAGSFNITLEDALSPYGVARFVELVDDGFFDDQVFYRVIPGFLTQFGVAADPQMQAKWDPRTFPDEPKKARFKHGTVSFAGSGLNSRSCHVFIAFQPSGIHLGGAAHETPLGQVTAGIEVLDTIQRNYQSAGYADLTHLQGDLRRDGNSAVASYPKLDRILRCRTL